MKRFLALLTIITFLASLLPCALAEDADEPVNAQTDAEVHSLDDIEEEEPAWEPLGPLYLEPVPGDFDASSPALYTCRIQENHSLFAVTYNTYEESEVAPRVMNARGTAVRADVLFVGQTWVIARVGKAIGYIKRDFIYDVEPVDPVNTPPYGVQKSTYIATTAVTCSVRKSMHNEDETWVVLNPGTMLSIWKIQDGWAIVPYWRTFGYINVNELTNLIPVSATDSPIRDDSPIAAYTSFYNMAQTESNIGRINNISVACRRLSRVMKPGESLDFNADVGPYKESIGYAQAPVLVNGKTQPGYGGGTCQVSSTLYNALMQLPGVSILQRRPHGPSGAKYLPHGVDAAVGNSHLNLRFRNNYDFSIRVEGHSSDDGALLMLVYRVDEP